MHRPVAILRLLLLVLKGRGSDSVGAVPSTPQHVARIYTITRARALGRIVIDVQTIRDASEWRLMFTWSLGQSGRPGSLENTILCQRGREPS